MPKKRENNRRFNAVPFYELSHVLNSFFITRKRRPIAEANKKI